jgi:hypothetical protein
MSRFFIDRSLNLDERTSGHKAAFLKYQHSCHTIAGQLGSDALDVLLQVQPSGNIEDSRLNKTQRPSSPMKGRGKTSHLYCFQEKYE